MHDLEILHKEADVFPLKKRNRADIISLDKK